MQNSLAAIRAISKSIRHSPAGVHWLMAVTLLLSLALPLVGITGTARAAPVMAALEVFDPGVEPVVLGTPLDPNARADTTAVPAEVPAGSLMLFVISGVVSAFNPTRGEWRIGSQPVFVYNSADTKLVNSPQVGDLVKIIALRTLVPGPIVAEVITQLEAGPLLDVTPANVGTAFLYQGLVEAADAHIWRVGGVEFVMDDPTFPAGIDAGLGLGSIVVVEFIIYTPPPPGEPPVLVALEIFAAVPNVVPPTLHPNPRSDFTSMPLGLPEGSIALFVISGVVSAVDGAGQEWWIGSPPTLVYTSADSRIVGAPTVGDGVKIIAVRSIAPGPIVVEVMTLLERGPLLAAPPSIGNAILFSGLVEEADGHVWRVGGVDFVVDDPTLGAAIDPGLGLGSMVTVEFIVLGATMSPPPAPGDIPPLPPPPAPPDTTEPSPPPVPAGTEIRFTGTVASITGNQWTIGPFIITVDASTRLDNSPGVGSEVEVRAAVQPDGSALATRITNLSPVAAPAPGLPAPGAVVAGEVRFTATVVSISGDQWHIGDFIVRVDGFTRLDGDPTTGSLVEVRAQAQTDGTALATRITNLTAAGGGGGGGGGPEGGGGVIPGGPGYGVPLAVSVSSTRLLLDRVGEVKEKPGEFEVRDRQYEATGSFPVSITSTVSSVTTFNANEIKVISNLRVRDGTGEHQGTVDIDIDALPGGHLTLEFRGSVAVSGSTITSSGTFRVVQATGVFAGIRSEGPYTLTIVESGATLGSPAMVTFSASGT
ncbi:MAG: hypothetical protein HYX99_04145 [Chloroflexi bacterium]|nr:hypothetical protein [Chloroflexota bacterium]